MQATIRAQTNTLNVCSETRSRLLEAEQLMQKQSTELDVVEKKLKAHSQLEVALWEEKRNAEELRRKLEGREEAHGQQIATLQSALSAQQSTDMGTLEDLKHFIAANCNVNNSARTQELEMQMTQTHTNMVRTTLTAFDVFGTQALMLYIICYANLSRELVGYNFTDLIGHAMRKKQAHSSGRRS